MGACLALVIAWGAALDPAEIVGGLHGKVDQAALTVRIPGSDVVAAVAIVTAVISLVWAWRDRPTLILAGWAALLVSLSAGYFVIPGVARASAGSRPESAELIHRRAALVRLAFGLVDVDPSAPPAFPSGEAAVRTMPVWDPAHVGAALGGVPATAVALRPPAARGEDRGAVWMIGPTNAPGPVRLALETDTGIAVTSLPSANAALLFGPGFPGPVVTSADSAPPAPPTGSGAVRLTGAWRRFAIAWTIQSWGLARSESNGRVLLWRRDVTERLQRLAPFARFGAPAPAMRNGALWWVSWGYVSHDAFPLVRSLPWRDDDVRFLRAGLVGAVRVATGETHLWLAPGYDSLTATWARRFEPLIEPADRLPADLRAQLAFPGEAFKAAVAALLRASADSDGQAAWIMRPREPYQLAAPGGGGAVWTAVALEPGRLTPQRLVGLSADAITPRGPELHLWRPTPADPAAERLPGELVGSSLLRPGQLRVWPVGRSIITVQAQIFDPVDARTRPPPRVTDVYVTLDGRAGHGVSARAALLGGEQIIPDTTLAARWERARRLAIQADSALGAGDLERFAALWRQLMSELAPARRPR